MKVRNPRSIIIIFFYFLLNGVLIVTSLKKGSSIQQGKNRPAALAPEYTYIEGLDYFHLREGIPQLSIKAKKMRSRGEELAEFKEPEGVYHYHAKNRAINYNALEGIYQKKEELLTLEGNVRLVTEDAEYLAAQIKYFFKKDLVFGYGGVVFKGEDLKTKDQVEVHGDTMEAQLVNQLSHFKGNVRGSIQRKKKYEGKMNFSSDQLQLEGAKSLAHLEGSVRMDRQNYLITARKADLFLENFNKSLKYFVFYDDVRVTESLQTPHGPEVRKAYGEKLEGFSREEKMVLSGAPKVEHGEDVVKGYRITIRENMDLIEVDDAMSDVQVKREKENKNKLKE